MQISCKKIISSIIFAVLLSCVEHPTNSIEDNRYKELLIWAIEEGDSSAYSEVSGDFFLAHRSKDFLYYALIMANKYDNAQAHYDVYNILTNNGIATLDTTTSNLALYHLKKYKELNKNIAMNNDSIAEIDTILEIVSKLPEVVKLEQRYNIDGNKSIILAECPNGDFNYFWVQVGVSTESRFETIYNFYLTPQNYLVYFYDTESDTIINLADWRKLNNWQ
jgi:hypothetical protein